MLLFLATLLYFCTVFLKYIKILYKIHKFLKSNNLNLLYQTFVHTYLTYDIEAW